MRGRLGLLESGPQDEQGDFSCQLSAAALVDDRLEVKAAGFAFIPQPLVEGKTD